MYDNDYITRFRNRVDNNAEKAAKLNDIIAQSLSKTEANVNGSINAIPIVFINDAKESGEESIIYTYQDAGVSVGNYLTVMGGDHLVYKQIKNIQQEGFINQFKAVACNIKFEFKGQEVLAYFKGPLRSALSKEEELATGFGFDSKAEAFIMLPTEIGLKANEKLVIDGEGWRTTMLDKLTNKGISYLSLEQYNIVYDQKFDTPEPIETVLIAGITNTFTTEGGYFKTSLPVQIISKTATSVQFIVPFGTTEITVDTKEDTLIKSVSYDVRG